MIAESDYKFCPKCKGKLTNTKEFFECKSCKTIIYKNSAPTASILLVDKDKVLLAKRAIEPFKGKYDVIGGFLKYGEDPVTGLMREIKEETALKVKITEMFGFYMDTYGKGGKQTLNIYYIGKIISGKMKPNDDVAELTWFPILRLPKPAFKNQERVFKDLKKWYTQQKTPNR